MPTGAYSIAEFCRAYRLSRAFFYVLKKRGEAPTVMKVGKRALVSDEAARHWRERMESAAALQSKVEMGDRK
jgi:hypothetical protein